MIDWTAVTAVIGSIATVAGTYGGYLLAGRNEEERDKRAASREASGRRAVLAERLEEERHTFQRDTMLGLQDEILGLVRSNVLMTSQDIKTLKSHGQMFMLPDDLGGDEQRQIVVAARRLNTRVLDSELRLAIGHFIDLCTQVPIDLRELEAEAAIRELQRRDKGVISGYLAIEERLGVHLRREFDRRILANELDGDAPGSRQ